MNYLGKFGIEFNPFVKNSKEIKVEFTQSKELLFRLGYLEKIKGIGILTGEPGVGKTTCVRHWTNTLNPSLYKFVYIKQATLTVNEFYKALSDELGLDTQFSKRKNFKNIQQEINRLQIEKKITPVIILDEANYLPYSVLNDLKLLLNFEMDSRDRFILLLIGQNILRNTLNLKCHEALRQRIVINYELTPLSPEDSRIYIDTKLKEAGLAVNLLTDEAYNQIINYSNGTIRIINQIMDKALLILSAKKADIIDQDIMLSAIDEFSI